MLRKSIYLMQNESVTMTDIILRRNMSIGTGAAENDGDFLNKCFIETPEYASVSDFDDKKIILMGRTGCGKTALIQMVGENADIFIQIRPDTFALQYINNIPFVNAMKEEGINLEVFYKFLWMHEITSNIIKKYFENNKDTFFDQIYSKIKKNKKEEQLISYLKDFGSLFFEEKRAEKITREVEKQLEAEIGYRDFAKLKGVLTETQRKEIQAKTSQCINSFQINNMKRMLDLFKDCTSSNKQKRIVVAIDDLDQNWVDEDSKYKLINSLLDAIRFFIDIPNLKLLIAMRVDILAKIREMLNRQTEKDNAFTLKINWTKNMIYDLLDRRIDYLFEHKYQKKQKVSLKDIFFDKIEGENATDYIISRTMLRPRDAIAFVNLCIANADGKSSVSKDNILDAENEFKYDRVSSLENEWINIYPNIQVYIKSIQILGNSFMLKDMLEVYEKIERVLLASDRENDPIVAKFLNSSKVDFVEKEKCLKALLNALFTIGVIALRERDKNIFATPNRPTLTDLDFSETSCFEIHPLFKCNN